MSERSERSHKAVIPGRGVERHRSTKAMADRYEDTGIDTSDEKL